MLSTFKPVNLKITLAWLLSFVSKKPVITGQGFTTDDRSLPETFSASGLQRRMEPVYGPKRKRGMACFRSEGGHDFMLVGFASVNGKVVARLHCCKTNKCFDIDAELFKLMFNLI